MKLKWGKELKLPYITILLLSQVFLLAPLCGSYVYVWKFSYEDVGCMCLHTWRYANTHPYTQLTPQQCPGLPLNELSVYSSFTQLTLSFSQFPFNESVILFLKCRKRSNRNTHRYRERERERDTHFTAAPSVTPSSWLWRENGGPLRSEWLRLHYPVKALVLLTKSFTESHIFMCVSSCTQN